MAPKMSEKEKEKRKENRQKRALIYSVEKNNIEAIKTVLDKSVNEMHQTNLDEQDAEFLRK